MLYALYREGECKRGDEKREGKWSHQVYQVTGQRREGKKW